MDGSRIPRRARPAQQPRAVRPEAVVTERRVSAAALSSVGPASTHEFAAATTPNENAPPALEHAFDGRAAAAALVWTGGRCAARCCGCAATGTSVAVGGSHRSLSCSAANEVGLCKCAAPVACRAASS